MAHLQRTLACLLTGVAAGGLLLTAQAIAAWPELPPGVSIAANDAFAPPEGLGAFQAMTFVIDLAPGAEFPLHSHPGRSEVMVIQGALTESDLAGVETPRPAGTSFMEEPGQVHRVRNTGSDAARLVWTILLPDGGQLIEPHVD